MKKVLMFFACFLLIYSCSSAFAEEAKKIQDNSFLLEEAYNQEDGVIQHIQVFQYMKKSKDWMYTFTQEWPVPKQAHQLSYTVPVAHVHGDGSTTGLGDIAINYRYQLVTSDDIAFSPRFSLILPTGDHKKGLGNGSLGYQINLPLSVELGDRWVTHWNAGATFTPNAKEASGAKADILGYNVGASAIYLVSENFNLMTELVWNASQSVQADGSRKWEDSLFINPGMRFAINYKSGLQVVPGISFPIGIGPSHGEYGVLLYLSFEHPFF